VDQISRVAIRQLAPISSEKHLVTKEYVDQKLAGAFWDPVDAATTSGLAFTTTSADVLTATANGELAAVDGVTLAVDSRILLKDQADAKQNGIYVVTALGDAGNPAVLTRADEANHADEFKPGKTVYVMPGGAVNGNQTYKQLTATAVVLGTTELEFDLAAETAYAKVATFSMEGDDTTTSFVANHNLGTSDVVVQIRNKTTNNIEYFGVTVTDANNVTIDCDPALATGEDFWVVIIGQSAA
jgi:hypothetical protein